MKKHTIIGITGGLATGKTTVTDMFVAAGAVKIDADKIAHELLSDDAGVKKKVVSLFGNEILTTGDIDRRKLADEVFADKEKLDQLCLVLHPLIIRRIKEVAEEFSVSQVVVVDAPLLIESGLHEYVDVVIVVTADRELQIKRAMDRGISNSEAQGIINCQMSPGEKSKFADHIIENNHDLNVTRKGVEEIWQKM